MKVGSRYGVKTVIVSNGGIRPSRDPMVQTVTVPQGPDAADDWIVESATSGDVVITSDIPLASRCLGKGAVALRPNGKEFDQTNIGTALAMRELKQQVREANQSQTYNAAFTARDRSNFLQALDRVLSHATR